MLRKLPDDDPDGTIFHVCHIEHLYSLRAPSTAERSVLLQCCPVVVACLLIVMQDFSDLKQDVLLPKVHCLRTLSNREKLGWVVQGLTSHQTHYRSFQRRVFCKGFPSLLQVKRPNHQHQYNGEKLANNNSNVRSCCGPSNAQSYFISIRQVSLAVDFRYFDTY